MNDKEYLELKQTILRQLRLDLDYYKDTQMRRRLTNYVAGLDVDFRTFLRSLVPKSAELRALKDFLTINVSEFFRDADQWRQLKENILPGLLKAEGKLNVWSAGCSHGGEPLTMAIILEELAPGKPHRILATDIDEDVLSRSRAGGPYVESDVRAVPKHLLTKYFDLKDDGHYWVKELARRRVEFRAHDLLADRYEKGFDLIMCRNVVIYFTEEAKERIYTGFASSLRRGGALFIGATEALLQAPALGLKRSSTCFYVKPPQAPIGAANAKAA